MKKRNSTQKKTVLYPLFAFLLPLGVVGGILALKGIWWGSDTTILASDGFHQYVIFNQTLRNALHGDGSLFYTFTSGLGLNFYALIAYYLGSFLSPLTYFFNLFTMPDALYIFALVKFGLTGLSMFYSLSQLHQQLHRNLILTLSTSYALLSFATGQLEINNWLDIFILIPLILLGLDSLLKGKGRLLYFTSLSILFIQNYYFGFMTAIFLVLWTITQLFWNFRDRIKKLADFIIVSLLATLTSMIMLLPTYLDLKTHGEKLTSIVNLQTEHSWWFDLIAKNFIGAYDTTKYGAIPTIYVGLFPLLLALLFFTLKSVTKKVKLAYAGLIILLIASFYLQPLDLFWQGMHAPNMFLHRYAWVFSVLIIYMAADTLSRFKEVSGKQIFSISFLLLIAFTVTYHFRQHYEFLNSIQLILTVEFFISYFILLLLRNKKTLSIQLFSGFALFFVLFEMSLNTYYQVTGLAEEWNFPSRESYQEHLQDIDNLVNKDSTEEFYRTERLHPQTGNDSLKWNYNGISQFSSIRNRASSTTLDQLGFKSEGTNLNLRYQNNTIIADSLFAVKYNLSTSDPGKFGFSQQNTENGISIYQNQYVLPLAILTSQPYQDVPFTNLTLDNQTHFLNQLTGVELSYFSSIQPIKSSQSTTIDNHVTVTAREADTASITYTLSIPAHTQLYVNIPNISFVNDASKLVNLSVNQQFHQYTLDNSFALFNAGYFETRQTIRLTIGFPSNQQVSFDIPQFYRLNTEHFQEAIQTLQSRKVSTKVRGNTVTTTYETAHPASLLYTLPYDKGWSAGKNGKPISISRAQNGLMKVDVPAGKGTLKLVFVPQGFRSGAISSILGILLFVLYDWIRKKTQKKHHTK